jgi:hypothetical protein
LATAARRGAPWLGYRAEWRSVCRFCGEPMVRIGPGRWRLVWKVRKAAEDER